MKNIRYLENDGRRLSMENRARVTSPPRKRQERDGKPFFRLAAVILATVFLWFGSGPVPANAFLVDIDPYGVGSFEPLIQKGLVAIESASESELIFDGEGGVSKTERAAAAYAGDGIEPIAVTSAQVSSACGSGQNCDIGFGDNHRINSDAGAGIRWDYIIQRKDGGSLGFFVDIPLKIDYRMSLIANGAEAEADGEVRIVDSFFGELDSTRCNIGTGRDSSFCPDGPAGTLTFTVSSGNNSNLVGLEIQVGAFTVVSAEGCESQGFPNPCIPKSEASAAEALAKAFLYVDPASDLADEIDVLVRESLNSPNYVPAVRTPILPLARQLFPEAQFFPAGGIEDTTVAAAIDDFNSDGNLDVAVATQQGFNLQGRVSVLLGDGGGALSLPLPQIEVGLGVRSIVTGDFNSDLIPDLVTVNGDGDDVSVLLGNNDGTFRRPDPPYDVVAVGDSPSAGAAADLDGDGDLDLAVANRYPDTVTDDISVLLNDGSGRFTELSQRFAVQIRPLSLVLGDVNGDGVPDLAVANAASSTISVLLGVGDGTFQSAQSFEAGDGPPGPAIIAIADLDADGDQDLVVDDRTSRIVWVHLGNGNGTFLPAEPFPAGALSTSDSIGDLDRDGNLDLIVGPIPGILSGFSVLRGNGGPGLFEAAEDLAAGKTVVLAGTGDMNNDGHFDLVSWRPLPSRISVSLNASASIDTDGDNIPDFIDAQVGGQGFQIASGEITGAEQPHPDGAIEITVEDQGQTFTFILPPGTTTIGPDDAIVLDVVSNPAQAEVQNAVLPANTTKAVTLSWPPGAPGHVVIEDQAGARVDDLPTAGLDQVIEIPTTSGQSTNVNVQGDPTNWTVTNNGDDTVTVSGLENTALGILDVTLEVAIDVKPWRFRNVIELEEDGECEDDSKLRVALLGSRDLDMRSVDVSTLALGDPDLQGTARPKRSRVRWVNRDRYRDLLLVFSLCELTDGALRTSTKQLVLTGETKNSISLQGSDSVRVVTDDDDDGKRRKWRPRRRGKDNGKDDD